MNKRVSLGKRLRFEVLKRDAFTCQYCGSKAPDVFLHVDHLVPVAGGGSNELVNLVAACTACNLGKGAVPLSDDSAVAKQRSQMAELQLRSEQIQMMLEWRRGLAKLGTEELDAAVSYLNERLQEQPGYETHTVTDAYIKAKLKKPLKKVGLSDYCEAVDIAFGHYDHVPEAIQKISGIAFNRFRERTIPGYADRQKLHSFARKSFNYYENWKAEPLIDSALEVGLDFAEMRRLVANCSSWSAWSRCMEEAIAAARQRQVNA